MGKFKDEQEQQKDFTRRAFLIAGIQGCVLGVLGGRLAWLQLSQSDKYTVLADENRMSVKMLAPSRGVITDRNGIPLALNKQNFRVLVIPEQTPDVEAALNELRKHIDISDRDMRRALKEVKRSAKFVPVEVRDKLSWEDVAKVEVRLPDLSGVSIDVGEVRHYPMGLSTAHIIGYVGAVTKSDLETGDSVLKLPNFKIGKTAIEKSLDPKLRGAAGSSQVEVNVSGREVRLLKKDPAQEGAPIALTIDSRLQTKLYGLLSEHKSATAIVMDAHTGAIYALGSGPSFDPNYFTKGMSSEVWQDMLDNPGKPLNNKAVAGQYPPGSTFKMISALAALEAGVINEKTTVHCSGSFEYKSDLFHCWKGSGHGWCGLTKALAESCDVYFYDLATKIDMNDISKMARRFGLGQKYDFELPEELAGLVPDKNWKMGHFGQAWKPGETVIASIGQGYLQSTPLQLAVMTARLVNGGKAVKPSMIGFIGHKAMGKSDWPSMGINQKYLAMVKKGMDQAVNDKNGTAFDSRIEKKGEEMGGKTGTSQVRRITMAQRLAGVKNENLPWKDRHHALFVGYAPMDEPKYIVSVVVEHGVGGSRKAAPLAKRLMEETQRLDPAQSSVQKPESFVS